MLPLQGVPVARRRRLLGLQITERRPVVDDPGKLLQGNPSYAVLLDFKVAMPTDQRKKVVPDRERTVVVGCYQFQAHVIVIAVHVPTVRQAAGDDILDFFHWKRPSLFKPRLYPDIADPRRPAPDDGHGSPCVEAACTDWSALPDWQQWRCPDSIAPGYRPPRPEQTRDADGRQPAATAGRNTTSSAP